MDWNLLVAVVDDAVNEAEGIGTLNFAADDRFKNGQVNGWKVFLDVALEHIVTGAHEVNESAQGAVGAIANAVGIRVVNKGALEEGLNDVAEGMVNYAFGLPSRRESR